MHTAEGGDCCEAVNGFPKILSSKLMESTCEPVSQLGPCKAGPAYKLQPWYTVRPMSRPRQTLQETLSSCMSRIPAPCRQCPPHPLSTLRTRFVTVSQKEWKGHFLSWTDCILPRSVLYLPAQPTGVPLFFLSLALGQPRKGSPLSVGGGLPSSMNGSLKPTAATFLAV